MAVAVVTEAEAMQVSAVGDMQVSVAASVAPAWLVATSELELADQLGPIPRGPIHPESQPDGMAGSGTTRRESRPERGFIVLLRVRKAEPLQGSLLARHATPVATTSREVNRG
jgi:hypothetical protein